MNRSLRPLNLGETLDCTVNLYRSKFLVFFGVAAVPYAALMALVAVIGLPIGYVFYHMANTNADPEPSAILGMLGLWVVAGLILVPAGIAVDSVGRASITYCADRVYHGEDVTIRECLQHAWQHFWRYLRLNLLQILITVGPIFVVYMIGGLLIAIGAVSSGDVRAAVMGIGIFLFFLFYIGILVYIVWIQIQMSMAFPACVAEHQNAWPSIQRSGNLVKGTRGRLLLILFLAGVIMQVIIIPFWILAILAASIVSAISSPENTPGIVSALFGCLFVGMFFSQMIGRSILGIAFVVVYYDQRVRKEGYDIEYLMQQAGIAVPVVAKQAAVDAQMFTSPPQWTPPNPYDYPPPVEPNPEKQGFGE